MCKHDAFSIRYWFVAGMLGAILVLSGCGGDGGGGSSGGSGSGGSGSGEAATLLFYQGSLSAIAPSNPTSPRTVDANAASSVDEADDVDAAPAPISSGDVSGGTVSNLDTDSVMYAREDGTLQRVSAAVTGGTPTPSQVSSESDADPVCESVIAQDFNNPDNARFAYASGDCTNPSALDWQMVTASDGSSTAPQDFPGQPVRPLNSPDDGSHAGWLAVNGSTLLRVRPDLGSAVGLGTVDGNILLLPNGQGLTSGEVFLNVEGDLALFDPASNDLTDLGFTFTERGVPGTSRTLQAPLAAVSDGDELYFVADDGLHRSDVAGDTTMALDQPSDLSSISLASTLLQVGTDRVAWAYTNTDGDTVLRSVQKSGGDAMTLATFDEFAPTQPGLGNLLSFRIGTNAFLSVIEGGESFAGVAPLDGSSIFDPENVVVVAGAFHGERPVAGSAPRVERVLLLDRASGASEAGNGTLHSLSANEDISELEEGDLVNIGTVPPGVQALSGTQPPAEHLLSATDSDDGEGDIFFYDSTQAMSLQRVTDNDRDEAPVPGF